MSSEVAGPPKRGIVDNAWLIANREFRERVTADFTSKLDGLLSPNQKAARDQSAADEIAAARNPKK